MVPTTRTSAVAVLWLWDKKEEATIRGPSTPESRATAGAIERCRVFLANRIFFFFLIVGFFFKEIDKIILKI